jgi:hypothetical protein
MACGIEKLFALVPMTTRGKSGKPPLKTLAKLARELAKRNQLPLELKQERNQKLLIAWYAEHRNLLEADVIGSGVLTPTPAEVEEGAQPQGSNVPPIPISIPNVRIVPVHMPNVAPPPVQPAAPPIL